MFALDGSHFQSCLVLLNVVFLVCCQTIASTQPDVVMVELCKSRVNILHMDEELILKEAQDMSFEKIRQAIRQVGHSPLRSSDR